MQNRPPALPPLDDSLPDGQKAAESWKRYLRLDDSKVVGKCFWFLLLSLGLIICISDIFVGQLKSELRCTSCGHVSITFDPFWDLSLPIPQDSRRSQVSLSDCLDSFTKEEVLDGDEKPVSANFVLEGEQLFTMFFPDLRIVQNQTSLHKEIFNSEVSFDFGAT